MSAYAMLLMVMATQPVSPVVGDVVAAWTERAAAIESADVELTTLRDSRHRSFGTPMVDGSGSRVRLRFDRELRQLEVSRLTVVRRDGRTQAAESDPDRARVEFRNVLLEEELKGPQMVPDVEPATLIVREGGLVKGQKLAVLDRLLAEAPLRSAQPLRFIDPAKLTMAHSEPPRDRLRLLERQSADRELELWVEAKTPYRPVRIIQHHGKRAVWQIDLTWAAEEPRFPAEYFAQTINGSGETLEFAEAKLTRITAPLPSSNDFGEVRPNRDQAPSPNASVVRMRSAVRKALDSNVLPVTAIALCAVLILIRARRKPAIS